MWIIILASLCILSVGITVLKAVLRIQDVKKGNKSKEGGKHDQKPF